MFGIQPVHLIVVALIALLIFGPKPISNFIRSFRKAGEGFRDEVKASDKKKSKENSDSKPSV